jgi:WD40 repeat protein
VDLTYCCQVIHSCNGSWFEMEQYTQFLTGCDAIHPLQVVVQYLPDSDSFPLTADTLGEQKGRLSITSAIEESVDTAVGFRSIAGSPDGNHLAAGDSSGNLRIFDLNSLLLHSFQVRTATLFFDIQKN